MLTRPASWYRLVAIAGAVAAVLMVVAMEQLQHLELSQWIHIPATAVVLTLMAGGAAAAGVGYLEFRARSAVTGADPGT